MEQYSKSNLRKFHMTQFSTRCSLRVMALNRYKRISIVLKTIASSVEMWNTTNFKWRAINSQSIIINFVKLYQKRTHVDAFIGYWGGKTCFWEKTVLNTSVLKPNMSQQVTDARKALSRIVSDVLGRPDPRMNSLSVLTQFVCQV